MNSSTPIPTTTLPVKKGWLKIFQADPPAKVMLTDPGMVKAHYSYWQKRVLISTIIGYALFYFVRKNLSIAMPAMGKDLGISKSDLGLFLTMHGLLYGVSKFVHGFFGDRANARIFMATGLILSAVMNVLFGFSSAVISLGLYWMVNGWVQGMGFPPCARLMTHWFSPKELSTKMSIWNTSHSIGSGLVVVLCGYLVAYNWRLCFFVPAGLAMLCAIFLLFALCDTPPSLGLPEVEGTTKAPEAIVGTTDKASARRLVFTNPYIWLFALANFFVYAIRYAVLDWGPTLLSETKGIKLSHAGWMVFAFEFSGVIGMILAGWITDKVFGGRGARTSLFSMMFAALFVFLFWKLPGQSALLSTGLLCGAGFFIYGPQSLIGTATANLATKHAAATAIGLTGLFGYASTILSGWGLGALVQKHGWNMGFAGMLICAGLGALMFLLAWPAKAHGYAEDHSVPEGKIKPSADLTGTTP
ncbi:MAG: transporter [Verrucomicrobiales bacterium]|nr:transporter [Verrucomicrobiales bacterium]